jgi:hypothetical protein
MGLLHGCSRERGSLVGLAHARLGVHALDGNDGAEVGIRRGLRKLGLAWLGSRVVGNEVEMLAG